MLPRSRGAAPREFWAILSVAHFPAEGGNLLAQVIAAFPIFLAPCVLAILGELRHFR